jgi:hypothetical protein
MYRIGLRSLSGVYFELYVSYNQNTQNIILVKYFKLYDGYSIVLSGNSELQKVT